jgi:hypothetical protein
MGLFGILIGFFAAMAGVVAGLFGALFGVVMGFFGLLLPLAPIILIVLGIVWLANGAPRHNVAPGPSWPAQPSPPSGTQSSSLHPHAGRQA